APDTARPPPPPARPPLPTVSSRKNRAIDMPPVSPGCCRARWSRCRTPRSEATKEQATISPQRRGENQARRRAAKKEREKISPQRGGKNQARRGGGGGRRGRGGRPGDPFPAAGSPARS